MSAGTRDVGFSFSGIRSAEIIYLHVFICQLKGLVFLLKGPYWKGWSSYCTYTVAAGRWLSPRFHDATDVGARTFCKSSQKMLYSSPSRLPDASGSHWAFKSKTLCSYSQFFNICTVYVYMFFFSFFLISGISI